jgi:3-deoxy-D-manno-octulosonic-acid transferase
MKFLYNFLIKSFHVMLPVLGFFFKRLRIFYKDRKSTASEFQNFLNQNEKPVIWTHVASLGEYEQVVPVLQILKDKFEDYTYIISFFSDSGYRNKKNKSIADFETYLPLDTPKKARDFINQLNPTLAIFVKYDIWPNFLQQLKHRKAPVFLVAARFRPNQIYFKSYGSFFKKAILNFTHIFVQDQASGHLLNNICYTDWTLSGDTRYDRVSFQLQQDNSLAFMVEFINNQKCMVCGSTWPEDEKVLIPLINKDSVNLKYVIAPHQIDANAIDKLISKIQKSTVKLSELSGKDLSNCEVLVIDNIGLLAKIYSYANIAYVGGGMGDTGLHNILEPATFGVPVCIGPHHQKFPEAKALLEYGGLKVVHDKMELIKFITNLLKDVDLLLKMSQASADFIKNQKGATEITINKITDSFNN